MRRSTASTVGVALVALVCTVAAVPLAAQEGVRPETRGGASTLPGPRLSPGWQSFEPRAYSDGSAAEGAVAAAGRKHTIQVTTVVLVVAAVVLVLLIT